VNLKYLTVALKVKAFMREDTGQAPLKMINYAFAGQIFLIVLALIVSIWLAIDLEYAAPPSDAFIVFYSVVSVLPGYVVLGILVCGLYMFLKI
jgi:hypothetical protein